MRSRERGAAAALFALMLPVLVGGLGLAVDGGHAFELKRRLQKQADAAAIAGAQELRRGNTDTYAAVALRDAERNGFDSGNAVFEILNPPATGPRKGNTGFVEVRVRGESPAYFMKLFTDPVIEVEAMAIAGVMPSEKCLYTLDEHAEKSLWLQGSATINLASCGIYVNSDADNAAVTSGGATAIATSTDVVGDYVGSGFFPQPLTGSPELDDPLADLPAPSFTACKAGGKGTVVKTPQTLNPGVYCGGLTVQANGAATLKPGLYIIYGGGLNVHGKGTMTGSDVTFYVTAGAGYNYDAVDFMANSVITLSASTSGTYAGILFFQDRAISSKKVNNFSGQTDTTLTGAMYFPTTDVKYTGSAESSVQKVLIVARNLELHGKTNLSAPDSASGITSPHLLRASLVW